MPQPQTPVASDQQTEIPSLPNPVDFWNPSWFSDLVHAWQTLPSTLFRNSVTSWPSWANLIPEVYAVTNVAFDAKCSTSGYGGTISCNLTHAANVLVLISAEQAVNNTTCSDGSVITAVSFNGNSMLSNLESCIRHNTNVSITTWVFFYYFSGGSGTHSASIHSGNGSAMTMIAESFTNAKSSSSFEALATASGSDSSQTSVTHTQSISAGTTGRMIFGTCSLNNGSAAGTLTTTVNGPLTSIQTVTMNDQDTQGDGYDQTASGITQSCTHSWSASTNDDWVQIGFAILPVPQVSIIFAQAGLGGDVSSGQVVYTIDSVTWTLANLPKTFTWNTGDTHTVACTTPITGSSFIYYWTSYTNPDGLSNCGSATYTVPGAGITVTANYGGAPSFTQSGLGSDVAGSQLVLTIDSTGYNKSVLPNAFNWSPSSTHSVVCTTPITGGTYVYDFSSWTNGDGLSGCSGTYTAGSSAVLVTANYVARPLITFDISQTGGASGATVIYTIDSVVYTFSQLPKTFNSWTIGSTHTVTAVYSYDGTLYRHHWVSWTNGDGMSSWLSQTYTTPSSDVTVIANYQYEDFTMSNGGTIVTNPGGNVVATNWVTATNVAGNPSVQLTHGSTPTGMTITFGTSPVTATGSSNLTVSCSSSCPYGTYTVTLTGTDGPRVHTSNLTVIVGGGPLVYVSQTVTQTPIITVSTTSTTATTVYSLPNQPQADYLTAMLALLIPLACFVAIGFIASHSAEGVGVGAIIGVGLGLVINVYLHNLPSWTPILAIVGLVAYAVARGTGRI